MPRRAAHVARPRRAGPAVTAATELRPHQREAVDAVVRALELAAARTIPERGMRTHVIMAPGSGRTRVAVRSSDELHASRVLVLMPSLDLLAQTEAAWREGAAAGPGHHGADRTLRTCGTSRSGGTGGTGRTRLARAARRTADPRNARTDTVGKAASEPVPIPAKSGSPCFLIHPPPAGP
ncbi:DEAD/DEAH box helicase family protein [Streptomyces sp. NPDC001549]|uniref:DEAD/DEAH box helicase family protein n=1 Tax=Streptomyces sp. NPDC001549 TaxID=3364586 RepID=UPI0036C49B94